MYIQTVVYINGSTNFYQQFCTVHAIDLKKKKIYYSIHDFLIFDDSI